MPLAQAQIEEAAAFLFHLRIQRQIATSLPIEIRPSTTDDAYAIQDAIHDTAGWPIPMLKVGCTSEFAQEVLGIPHPIGGRVPAEGVFESGNDIPMSYFGATPSIECEVALQVDGSGAVVAAAPAMELVDPRIQSQGSFGGMTTIADNSGGCAVVLGNAVPIETVGELGDLGVELRSDGDTLAEGSPAAVLGGPAASVGWAIDHEASRGRALTDGLWIITGTCSGLTPTEPGRTYTADFGALGSVSFTLTA